jgi:mRNA interferase MazF
MKYYNGIRRGDIYFCQLDKKRPAVIVSNNIMNATSQHFLVVPLSSSLKRTDLPTHVPLKTTVNGRRAMAMTEHLYQVNFRDLNNFAGILGSVDMQAIDHAIIHTLGLQDELY